MSNEEMIQKWITISDEELDIAKLMLKSKHYLYVAFMCQQSIEKIFKGYYIYLKADTPPYIHSLMSLAEKGGFLKSLSSEQIDRIELIEKYYINTRYPDVKASMASGLSEEICKNMLENAKNIQQWIKEKM